jgi:hypothetical protein
MGFLAGSNARRKPKSLVNGLCLAPKLQLPLALALVPELRLGNEGADVEGRRWATGNARESWSLRLFDQQFGGD